MFSPRQRRFIRRMSGYATNPVQVRIRSALHREQPYRIGSVDVVLPPEHNLPFYQRRDPTYDDYAIEVLARLAGGMSPVTVIDVGANVGDTAATVLSSAPTTEVICVEGDPRFVSYLRRNLAPYADRARIVEGFVGPVGSRVRYQRDGSTGGFNQVGEDSAQEVTDWVRPAELLELTDPGRMVVWKSDIDGFDIHVLAGHFDVIDERCDVMWFEYDPPRTLGDRADIDTLIQMLADSGRTLLIYDNLGRRMLVLDPGSGQVDALRSLTGWLGQQYAGHVTVPYLDIWAVSEAAGALLSD